MRKNKVIMTDFMQKIAKRLTDVEIEVKRLRDKDVCKPGMSGICEESADQAGEWVIKSK